MKKQTFEKGDRVFDINYGWGKVIEILNASSSLKPDYKVLVRFKQDFNKEISVYYSIDGYISPSYKFPTLSFTEYDIVNGGFSQERLVNYEDYIGKWGRFCDKEERIVVVGKLINYLPHLVAAFEMKVRNNRTASYENFEPLTEEQIKVLGLCD